MNKKCKTCKYCKKGQNGYVCTNPDSEYIADEVGKDNWCEKHDGHRSE